MRVDRKIAGVSSLLAAAVLLSVACHSSNRIVGSSPNLILGNGNVVEQSRAISGCSSVTLQGVGIVYIQQGAQEQLRVRAEENVIGYLRTDLNGGELLIWTEPGVTFQNSSPIEYHLTVLDLARISLTGAGTIEAVNLDIGPLELMLTGVGNANFVNLTAPNLVVDATGVGNVTLSGSVPTQSVTFRRLGEYDARDLASFEADVLNATMMPLTVRVRDRLHATISGSGNVYYIGSPAVTSTITGTGSVIKIGG